MCFPQIPSTEKSNSWIKIRNGNTNPSWWYSSLRLVSKQRRTWRHMTWICIVANDWKAPRIWNLPREKPRFGLPKISWGWDCPQWFWQPCQKVQAPTFPRKLGKCSNWKTALHSGIWRHPKWSSRIGFSIFVSQGGAAKLVSFPLEPKWLTYGCGYIYTWNPNNPYFEWKGPSFGGFKAKNRGQTGSRYIYIYITWMFLEPLCFQTRNIVYIVSKIV